MGMPRSIRFRITAIAVALSAGLMLAVSLLMVSVLRWQLTDNLDEGLSQRADTIESVASNVAPSELVVDEDLLVQLVDVGGAVVMSSSNLTDAAPIASLEPGIRTLGTIHGRPETFRVLTRVIEIPSGPATLLVGINYDDVNDPLGIVSKLLAGVVPAVLLVLGLLVWWLTGRTLRPVEQIRVRMAEISESNLGGRVPEPNTGDEIDRLARTTNQTLDRLEDAVRRQQRFVADASHELRSPLTRIRSELEVDLANPEQADAAATERSILAETIGLQHLVEDLLQLARSDGAATEMTWVAIDLDDIVLHEVRAVSERGRVRIDSGGVSAAHVTGDTDQLRRAVKNLLDNAERHAASTVTVTLDEIGGQVRLTVGDDGAGIAPDDRVHVFERFTRLDEARTRDTGGSGLGLAITRDIFERHGGTIRLADSAATEFIVEFPLRR